MALGDGTTWDETLPTDSTVAVSIDDHIRDIRKGVRSRLALEHEFPASQSATSEAGVHKFVTLQNQAAKPTLAGTQVGALYAKTSTLYFEDSAGVEVQITEGTGISAAIGSIVGMTSTGVSSFLNAGSPAITADDSKPQITEGTELFTLTYTPLSTANELIISANVDAWPAGSGTPVIALFQDTTASALCVAAVPTGYASWASVVHLDHVMSPTTTGACVFRLRGGSFYMNGYTSRLYGGACVSRLTIMEVKR